MSVSRANSSVVSKGYQSQACRHACPYKKSQTINTSLAIKHAIRTRTLDDYPSPRSVSRQPSVLDLPERNSHICICRRYGYHFGKPNENNVIAVPIPWSERSKVLLIMCSTAVLAEFRISMYIIFGRHRKNIKSLNFKPWHILPSSVCTSYLLEVLPRQPIKM